MSFNNGPVAVTPIYHPQDPSKMDIDTIGYALEKLQTYLIWSEAHSASYMNARNIDIDNAKNKMSCLRDAIYNAVLHLNRLTELIISGQGIDRSKKIPRGLSGEVWQRIVADIVSSQNESAA